MADLIDRDALMKEICGNECGSVCDEECENVMCNFYDYIMDASAVNRWISVEDALPEENVSVICYMRIGEIVVMEYGEDGWYCGVTRYYPRSVTHWMPLPEPPKE